MQVNKELTAKFYENFTPCNCGDCRYFIKNIESEQPEVCQFLKSLGINPLKPYELASIFREDKKQIEYLNCAYLVIGTATDNFKKQINGITIETYPKEIYPFNLNYPLNICDSNYFFIGFDSIAIDYAYIGNRHFTYKDKVEVIKNAIDQTDPMQLLESGCPSDEYIEEAKLLAYDIHGKRGNFVGWKQIQDVFKRQFDETLPPKICKNISFTIATNFEMKDYFRDFQESDLLNGKVSLENGEIVLKVHENFVVKNVCGNTCINDKFYYDIEDQDLYDCLCDFVKNGDIIYIQYKNKHLGLHLEHPFRYFKEVKRDKYNFNKLRHKKDIELIFDNNGVIYACPNN